MNQGDLLGASAVDRSDVGSEFCMRCPLAVIGNPKISVTHELPKLRLQSRQRSWPFRYAFAQPATTLDPFPYFPDNPQQHR